MFAPLMHMRTYAQLYIYLVLPRGHIMHITLRRYSRRKHSLTSRIVLL